MPLLAHLSYLSNALMINMLHCKLLLMANDYKTITHLDFKIWHDGV